MKHFSRKIFLSVGVLCLAIVAFATTTFAWFTLSTTAKINDFSMSIKTDSNLVLRATVAGETPSTDYASVVTLPSTAFAKANNQLYPIVYDTNGSLYKSMNKKTRDLDTITGTPGTNSVGYIQIKLEFQTNASGVVVVNSIGSKSTAVAFTSAANTTLKNGTLVPTGGSFNSIPPADGVLGNYVLACNALRTQFYSSKLKEAGSSEYVIDALTYSFINHSGEGEGDYGTDQDSNTALKYFNTVTGVTKTVIETQKVVSNLKTVFKEDGTTLSDTSGADDGADLVLSQAAAKTTPIVSLALAEGATVATATAFVRVWIDGWDADCFNAVLLQKIVMNLSFEFLPA